MAQLNYFSERRCECRKASNQRVIVTEIPNAGISFRAELMDSSEHGLGLRLVFPFEAGTEISVEWNDKIILGQVVHCRKSAGKYNVGTKTEYVILDLSLSRLPATPAEKNCQRALTRKSGAANQTTPV